MLPTTSFRTCAASSQSRLRVKGSRFLALLEPCPGRVAAEHRLAALREQYRDATHVCWAWRLLSEQKPGEASSDAGEPAGSAGVPMLGVLRSHELWNVLGVVVRWFGGKRLGRGGLVRAYRQSLSLAAAEATIIEAVPRIEAVIRSPLSRVGDLHRVLSALDVTYVDEAVDDGEVWMTVSLPARDMQRLCEQVAGATQGQGSVSADEKGSG